MNDFHESFVGVCTAACQPSLVSILFYVHPFISDGYVLIFRDDTSIDDFLTYLGDVYTHKPDGYDIYCIRESELDLLAAPGMFAPPLQINEKAFLPYWLKHKGIVLYGNTDLSLIPLPEEPGFILAAHIEGCMDYLRRYGVLTYLAKDKYEPLIYLLDQEISSLMTTAVLSIGQWDIDENLIETTFFEHFPDMKQAYTDFKNVSEHADYVIDKVWEFEKFLHQLREAI